MELGELVVDHQRCLQVLVGNVWRVGLFHQWSLHHSRTYRYERHVLISTSFIKARLSTIVDKETRNAVEVSDETGHQLIRQLLTFQLTPSLYPYQFLVRYDNVLEKAWMFLSGLTVGLAFDFPHPRRSPVDQMWLGVLFCLEMLGQMVGQRMNKHRAILVADHSRLQGREVKDEKWADRQTVRQTDGR